MAIQFSAAVRNARLNAIFATIGASAKLLLYTGSVPANCAASATGSLLATLTLPSTEENAASGGAETQASSPWTGTASAAGTAGYFRVMDPTGATCHVQGTVGQGSGDLSFDNPTFASGQNIQITSFTLTDGNA
ncbi:MAG: hypothetical protein ABSA66_15850 [Roseiarcus sp.]|jgi:hypothetical protein